MQVFQESVCVVLCGPFEVPWSVLNWLAEEPARAICHHALTSIPENGNPRRSVIASFANLMWEMRSRNALVGERLGFWQRLIAAKQAWVAACQGRMYPRTLHYTASSQQGLAAPTGWGLPKSPCHLPAVPWVGKLSYYGTHTRVL